MANTQFQSMLSMSVSRLLFSLLSDQGSRLTDFDDSSIPTTTIASRPIFSTSDSRNRQSNQASITTGEQRKSLGVFIDEKTKIFNH